MDCFSILLETAQQEEASRHLDAIRTWPSAPNGGLAGLPGLLSDAVGCESFAEVLLAWIIHECRRAAFETEARRGFSHVRPTEAYWQSVEEAE